jgi:hypothetical protein
MQLSDLLKEGVPHDPKLLAAKLQVMSRELDASPATKKAVNEFFENHRLKMEASLSLDGVGYDIWYVDSATTLELSLVGGEHFEKGEPSFVTWARDFVGTVPDR